jgi:hypothetical protein
MRAFLGASLVVAAIVVGCNSPAFHMPPPSSADQKWIDTCGIGFVLCGGAPATCCVQGEACCGGGFPEMPCAGGPGCEATLDDIGPPSYGGPRERKVTPRRHPKAE